MKLFKNIIQNKILLVLTLICLILFRYDFTYNLLPYKINSADTLWNILEEKVYHNSAITGISLQYLQLTNSKVDLNKVMKNDQGEGGYKVNIFLNKITIVGPDNKTIINNALILPASALFNHAIQVLTYNIVVLALAFFLYTSLKDNKFKLNILFLKNTFSVPILLFVMILLIMFILLFFLIIFLNYLPDAIVPVFINPETNSSMQELRILDKPE